MTTSLTDDMLDWVSRFTGLAITPAPPGGTPASAAANATKASGGAAKHPAPAPILVSIEITIPAPLVVGGQQPLKATGAFSDDSTRDLTKSVTWNTDTNLVTVTTDGLAKATRWSGKATFTATDGDVTGSLTVMIRTTLEMIVVTPENPLIEIGQTRPMTATGVFADKSTEDITHEAVWQSFDPKVSDFPVPGFCVAVAAGTSTVVATVGAISGATRITVPAAGKAPTLRQVAISPRDPDIKDGAPVAFRAMGTFSDKSTREITDKVVWESSRPDVLLIDSKGVATVAPGEIARAEIGARDAATRLFDSTACYVETPGIKSLTISPQTLRLISGDTAALTVTAVMAGGGQMTANGFVTWQVADPAIAAVAQRGEKVSGVAPGTTRIEAVINSSPDIGAGVDVTVLPPVLRSIFVTGNATLRIGDKETYTATGFFSDQSTKDPLLGLNWHASGAAIEIDKSTAEATAKATGKITITAEDPASHRTGTREVEVVP